MTEQVRDRATLVLASVAKRVKRSHTKWATSVIQRLENRLGIHGIYALTCYILFICGRFKKLNKNSVEKFTFEGCLNINILFINMSEVMKSGKLVKIGSNILY